MKDVKNAHFLQVDRKIEKISEGRGFVVLPAPQAFEELSFVRDYFGKKPKEGYFIWIKRSVGYPLTTCISISSVGVSQNPKNLIVIEKNVKAEIESICNTIKKNLKGKHRGYSKVILRENSKLKIKHLHSWGKKDIVASNIEFFLEKGAKLSHTYKCLEVAGELRTENNTYLQAKASANMVFTVFAKNSKVEMRNSTFLNAKDAKGVSRIRMVGGEKSHIFAQSRMIAQEAGIGYIDCMGLLLADSASIQAVPELINKNKDASLTHEASVGKISEEILSYLRTRGLSKDEAIDLIVAGFLGEEEPVVIKGQVLKSEFFM